VAGLRVPLMPYQPSNYAPTWVEWSIMTAGFALFALLITVFVKLFPIISVWEMAEEHEYELTGSSPAPERPAPAAAPAMAGGGGS